MSIREALLAEIEAFLASTGMKHTVFGSRALRDPAFVTRLRKGGDVRSGTIERVRDFIRQERERVRPKKRQPENAAA